MEASMADWPLAKKYHFLTSAVAPRPIAWVTTVDTKGVVNAAPFSWYQTVCAEPPLIMLALADRSDGSTKDTLANVEATGELVVNLATLDNLDPLVETSRDLPPGVSEIQATGLETKPSRTVRPPRLAASPVQLECRLFETRRYGEAHGTTMIVAEVLHVHAEDAVLDERGSVDPAKVTLIARLGRKDYAAIHEVFEHQRPASDDRR